MCVYIYVYNDNWGEDAQAMEEELERAAIRIQALQRGKMA